MPVRITSGPRTVGRGTALCVVMIMLAVVMAPTVASADVYVGTNFYIGTVIAIGGLTIYLVFSFGGHSRHASVPPVNDHFLPAHTHVITAEISSPARDFPVQEGMLRVMEW